MMKIEIVGIDTPPLLQFWSGAEVSPFVAFYDGNISTAVIFLPEAVDRKDSIARNKVELLGKKSPNGALYDGRVATAQANLPRNGLHLKHQPLRHVQLTGFKISSADIIIYNEEFLSMARTLVLDFKEFLEDQLTSLMNLDLLKRELSLSTAYNQTMFATLDPGEVESRIVIPPSNPRYLAELKKDGLPFVAFYDGIVATAVIFLPGDVDYLKSPPNSARNKTEPGEREGPFVAFYDGVVATAQIFLPGAVDQTDALTSSPRNKVELVKKRNPYFAFYDESVARTQAILPRNVQRLKHQPLRHVQLVGLRNMESPYITHNEEFLSMARTLVLDYKEFLEDQLTSLMNLDLLKRELSLSTAYNQTMLATLDPGEVESRVVIPPSNPRYLAELKKDGLPFVAFYDGIVATAVIFLPGDVDYLKSPPNSARNKTEPGEREGPFVAFYDGVVATAQIFLPGAVDQTHALTSSPRNKVELVKKRNPYFAFYDERVARTQAILPRNVQRLKHQPLRHVQLVGLRNMDSPYITHNEEFLSMARTLVLDFKEFLEDQLSSLMNLALLKRELSLSTAYNQTMLATLDPGEVESRVVIPPSNPRYLAELKKDGLPFVAFYDGIVATAVIFLPGDVDYLKSPPNSARNKTEPGEREGPFVAFYDGIVATAVIFLPGHAKPLVPAPPTPRSSTQMETEPSQDIISNERKLTKPRVLLPFLQKEVPPEMVPPKPRPLVRPQWSRVEKCRLLRDKLDGLPLRYKPRTTKYISFKENEMDTKRRILNAIPSLKPVPPGSCLARSPLTPWYWLEDTYPDMVSASLKDLATQHMKYFRAIPSRAPAQQAGRSQIQIMEDLYWEEVKKMRVPETADENYSRLQLVRCFIRKIQCGSIIKETSLISEGKDKPGDLSQVNTKTAQLNYTACLNTNNNGYTKEEGDCDLDTVNSSVFGSKSDRGFSRGQDVVRNKPRHSYLNKRHSDGYRSRNRRPTGADGAYVDCDKTCVEPEKRKTNAAEDTAQLTDSTLQQCHSRDAKLPQGKEDKILLSIKRHPERGLMPPATYRAPTSGHHGNHLNKVVVPPLDLQDDSKHLKELFKDVSQYNSLCDVPDSVKERVVLLICTPFLEGGYSSGLCFLSNLIESSEESSPGRPWQNLEQCLDQCGSTEGTAQNHTSPSMESEEYSTIQMERDLWYREAHYRRHGKFPVFEDNPTNEDDFMGDLCFTNNSPDERAEPSHSFLHDDFSHEDDVLDIPTLSILSPSRASLGQAYRGGHPFSCMSTLDHDQDKLASNEPFPSEYVFKRACGPSFSMSSEFWHIKIPTLPSNMVDFKVEQDGLTEIVIGSGSFGEVYAATLTVSPGLSRDVVVKEHFTDKTTLDSVANEAKITMYLESTGCVPICYGLLMNEEDCYSIVMEYVGSGQTLYDIMCESGVPRLHWLNIVCQLANGLKKIHNKDVLINDIKSDNILVDMSGALPTVKFCDMGTASYKSGVTYKGAMEECVHLAPEACAHVETTPACDVYSFGRVLKKIHGVSHISALLSLSDTCMAEDPADRPTLSTLSQRLQDEYTKEVLFPTLTLTVPLLSLDFSDEETEDESAGSVGVNTPINIDTSSPSSAEVNGAVSSDIRSSRGSNRSIRSGEVSTSNNKDLATMLIVEESGTSLGFVNSAEVQDSSFISKIHMSCSLDPVSSYGHATYNMNMHTGIEFSAEIKDTSVVTSKSAQDGSPSLTNYTDAATSKSAHDGSPSLTNYTDAATSKSAQDGSPSLTNYTDAATSKSAQDGSPSLTNYTDAATSKSAQDGSPSLTNNTDAATSKSAQDGSPSLTNNTDAATSKSAQDGSPSLTNYTDAATSKSAQDGCPSLTNNTDAATSKSAQDGSPGLTNYTDAATSKSAQDGSPSLTNYTDAATSKSAQDGSPSLTNNTDAATSKSAQDGSPSLTNNTDAATSKSAQDGSPSLTNNTDDATSKSAQDGSPSLTNNTDDATSKSAQDGSPSLTNYTDAATSKSAQDGSPSLTNNTDAATSKSAQDGSPSLTNNTDDATSKSAQDGSPSLTNYTDAATSKSAQDGSPSLTNNTDAATSKSAQDGSPSLTNNTDDATSKSAQDGSPSLTNYTDAATSKSAQDGSPSLTNNTDAATSKSAQDGSPSLTNNTDDATSKSAQDGSPSLTNNTDDATSKSAQDGSPSLTNYTDAATSKSAQDGSPSLTNNTDAATSKSAQDGSPSLTNNTDAATSKSAQDGSPSLTNNTDDATSKSAQDGSPSLTNYTDAATSKSAQDGSPSLTNYTDAATSKSAQDGSPSLTNNTDAATSKSAQDGSPSLTNYTDAATSKSAQDGSPSLTNYTDAATSKSAQDGSPSLTNNTDDATSKSAQDGSPSLTNYTDAATSKSAQDGSPSLTNNTDAATSKSAQDGSPSLTNNTDDATSKSAQDGSPSLTNYTDAATSKSAQDGSPSLTNYTDAATSKSAQDGSPSLTNNTDAATSKSAQDGSPSLTNNTDDATSKSAQDGSPSLTNYTDAATSKSAQDGSPSLTNNTDAATSKSAQDGSPRLTNNTDAATSKSAQDGSPSLTNYTDAATSKSAQDGSPSLTNNTDAATSKSAQDGSPSLTNNTDAATSKSAQDGSPSLTNNTDAATSKSAQDGSPSLTNYTDAATSKSAQDGSPSLTNYTDAATSKSAQDGSPSLTNYTDAATSKSAQDGSPSLTNNTDAATSKSAQDGSPSLTNNTDAATSKSAHDGCPSLDASSTGETLEIPSAFHSPNGSPGRYTPTANSLYISTPTTASCATSQFHTPSASPELFSAVGSPRFFSATETPNNTSCERHRLDASSDIFVDAVEDHPAVRNEVDVVAAVDGSPSPSDLDAPHTAAYRALCQKELDVYNKHCEDTPMYEDYLPLVLPLLLLPLGILGFI